MFNDCSITNAEVYLGTGHSHLRSKLPVYSASIKIFLSIYDNKSFGLRTVFKSEDKVIISSYLLYIILFQFCK
jgi:hypothetical protein